MRFLWDLWEWLISFLRPGEKEEEPTNDLDDNNHFDIERMAGEGGDPNGRKEE